MAELERVAFLGLGIMGSRMAANLRRAGFEVVAWNRTRARAEELAEAHGAQVADTPAGAARDADITITMVVDAPEVEAVLFGPHGAVEGMASGHLCIDMSTIAPSAARRIGAVLARRKVGFLDAPVTGSKPKAEDGTLTIMVGGEASGFERARPLFGAMGELVLHIGPQGHGQMLKLLNNTVAAINAVGVAEALTIGRRAGVDVDSLIAVMKAGTGASAMLDLKAGPMLERDFEPMFKLEHMLKDIRHCVAEARALGARFSLGERVERLYSEASSSGLSERDFAAVIEAVEREGA